VIAEMERWAQLGWRATRKSLWLTAPPLALGLVAAITATVSVALATELPGWHAGWIADYLSIYAIGWTAVVLAVVAFMRLPTVRLPVEWSAALALADALAAINETDAGEKRPASVTARRLRDLERVVRRSLRRRYGSDRRLPDSRTTRRLAQSSRQLAAWAAGNRAVAQRESTQLCWSLSGVWREDCSSESSERVVSVHWPSRRFPFGSTTAIATAGPITLLLVDVLSRLIAGP